MTVSPDLDRRFREAAATLGLIDVGFDIVDSPIGPLFVAASDRGLASISYDAEPEEHLEKLARIAGPAVLRSPRSVDAARRELDEYFSRRRRVFDLSLDLRALPQFTVSVLERARARAVRGDDDVRRSRAASRPSDGRPGSRHRDEPEPHPDRPALPPRRRARAETSRAMPEGSTASSRCSSSKAPARRVTRACGTRRPRR